MTNGRAFEAHVRFAPRTAAAAVAKPFVIDAEPSRPAHSAVDDDAAHVGPVLREMQCREAQRAKGFDDDPGSAQFIAMTTGNVNRTEGVVKNEYPHARLGTFTKYLTELVGHATRRAVIQLQGDRQLR